MRGTSAEAKVSCDERHEERALVGEIAVSMAVSLSIMEIHRVGAGQGIFT